ncbi:MAG: matrixin family metalloprotease [Candidatus Gastranaerophilaceae bacterium]|nr:matrixin family metalloprotease [Candidatus Gastranaerophilaceae bacterium]
MAISNNIQQYIDNSKIRGQLCRWDKQNINVYITPITANINNKDFMFSQVQKAIQSWNDTLQRNGFFVRFYEVNNPQQADITVHWIKVGRVYEGMCKYLSVIGNSIKKISIEIGLPNEFSGKDTTDLSIYCAIMHEFGHALGLGHGVEIDDIMFVPHKKNIPVPDENDLYVLKKIYK